MHIIIYYMPAYIYSSMFAHIDTYIYNTRKYIQLCMHTLVDEYKQA